VLAFVAAVAFFAAAIMVDDWRVASGVLFVGVVCWTVFVQDHMSGKTRR
jgi:hypothetical protein